MNNLSIYQYVESFFLGVFTGAVFFYGLWLTVQKIKKNQKYIRIMVVSWFLRMTFFVGMFYLFAKNDFRRILLMFCGVLFVRYCSPKFLKVKG